MKRNLRYRMGAKNDALERDSSRGWVEIEEMCRRGVRGDLQRDAGGLHGHGVEMGEVKTTMMRGGVL